MAFEPKKFNDLYDAMRARTTVLTDFEVGSVTRTMYESFAYELGLLYQKMQLVYQSAFVDSAEGTHLDQVVAVLGIQRGLPDFSVGEATFFRDKGNADINIPAGTMVATEDSPEKPKKVYQTVESATLAQNQAEVRVKIQAVERGEEQDVPADAIVVMPRPVPGIKSVNNTETVRLVGRRRETDEELRRRAKNALLSSGKANIAAIENAVLALPGVLDVKVREDFHRAKGLVTLSRAAGPEATVPKGSLLRNGIPPNHKLYRLVRDVLFDAGQTSKTGQIESLLEGKSGELAVGQTLVFEPALPGFAINFEASILQSQFGMADVVVDTPDFEKIRPVVEEAVESVRAAGVYMTVTGAKQIKIDGVFRVEKSPQLQLTPEETLRFEEQIRQEIVAHFQSVKMGQTLLFSKLMKAVLSVQGVEDLSDFRLLTRTALAGGNTQTKTFVPASNRIETEELERFYPDQLCVASEDKLLPVNISFKAASLDKDKYNAAKSALEAYLNGLGLGIPIVRTAIVATIPASLGATSNLRIKPVSWCPNPNEPIDETTAASYVAKFVEKPALGNLFVYNAEVALDGALALVLPGNVGETEKADILADAKASLNAYLEGLPPETPVVLDDLLSAIKKDARVLDTRLEEDDIEIKVNNTPDASRLNQGKITVKVFEKATTNKFPVVADIYNLPITATNISLVVAQGVTFNAAISNDMKTLIKHTVDTYTNDFPPGKNLNYNDLKTALQNLSFGFNFTLTELSLAGTSKPELGFDAQSANSDVPRDIIVRSVELPSLSVALANIIITQ